MPKATTPTATRPGRRHNPLEDDVLATGILRNKPTKRKGKDVDESEETFVDSKASKNILRIGRELMEEENADKPVQKTTVDNFGYDSRFGEEDGEQKGYDDEEAWGDEDEMVEDVEVDPEDLDTYRKFMGDEEEDDLLKHGWDLKPSGAPQGESVNLADLILEKIAAHEAAQAGGGNVRAPDDDYELPPKVVEVYTK
jgi:essential nuclear protein 1